ncbi:MAG: VOC family protein [Alphaproteobacteria bacterium]|nr:VOC family protein [Alphaproteobacteria bacterium]
MIKVKDAAYVRFRAPDLDRMEQFLVDFGMVRSARTDTCLFMRGTDPTHHLHVTELGDPAFVGMAFNANAEEDLATLSRAEGASDVEDIDEPGGGKRVRLTDPDGTQVEVVYGLEEPGPLPVGQAYLPNRGSDRNRFGDIVRNDQGPAQVKRLGHILITSAQIPQIADFYRSHFGFLLSDEIYDGDENNIVAAFNRIDRGKEFVDHHTLVPVFHPEKTGLQHAAFEVENIDAVAIGQEYLKAKGYKHSWGIGRHFLGSQIFDYWYDPYGNIVEHFIDGDLLNDTAEPGLMSLETALATQWGPPVPEEFL